MSFAISRVCLRLGLPLFLLPSLSSYSVQIYIFISKNILIFNSNSLIKNENLNENVLEFVVGMEKRVAGKEHTKKSYFIHTFFTL